MKLVPPVADYVRIFEAERRVSYPAMDAEEQASGYALTRDGLEQAARVLACPVKAAPPNWQHGRLIYSRTRRYLQGWSQAPVTLLDLGTAKGFSALCLLWALKVTPVAGRVVSVDVIDPKSHARRNTVAECDGVKTLAEILAPWPESIAIEFLHTTGLDWLSADGGRVHVAWVDGKHTEDVVRREGDALARRQEAGDLALFDDLQIPDVARAVASLSDRYHITPFPLLPNRAYAIGVRK